MTRYIYPSLTILIKSPKTLYLCTSLLRSPLQPNQSSFYTNTWTSHRLDIVSTTATLSESSTSWRRSLTEISHTPLTKPQASEKTLSTPMAQPSIIFLYNSLVQDTADWSLIQTLRNPSKYTLTRNCVRTGINLLRAMTPTLQNYKQVTFYSMRVAL